MQQTQTVRTLWELKLASQNLLVAGEMLKEWSTPSPDSPEDYVDLWNHCADEVAGIIHLITQAAERAGHGH